MDPGRWARIKEIFEAACECEPGRREALVGELCGGDEALRAAVNGMLSRDTSAAGFMEAPALEVEARDMARGLEERGEPTAGRTPYRPMPSGPRADRPRPRPASPFS